MSDHPLVERARSSRVPVADLIGFSIEPVGDGQARGWLDATSRHANPMGTLHGDILCDVADAAMGMAFVTTLATDESFTTMLLAINFFRPVWVEILDTKRILKHDLTDVGRHPFEIMTSVALTTAVTTSAFLSDNSSALRRVITDSISFSPTPW